MPDAAESTHERHDNLDAAKALRIAARPGCVLARPQLDWLLSQIDSWGLVDVYFEVGHTAAGSDYIEARWDD